MAAGVRTLGIHHLRKGSRDVVEIVLVNRHARLSRGLGKGGLVLVISTQHVPERRSRRYALEDNYEVRIEPCPRPVPSFAQRRVRAVRDMKHIDYLCKQRDARISGDFQGAQT